MLEKPLNSNDATHVANVETKPGKFDITISFLHLILLHKNVEYLQEIVQQIGKNNIKNAFKQIVNVTPVKPVISEDSWIFGASCLHLAAKFWPEGLQILLPVLEKCPRRANVVSGRISYNDLKDLIDQKNDVENNDTMTSVTPLHIAVTNCDSLSTR